MTGPTKRLAGSAAMSPRLFPSATARAKRSFSAAITAMAAMYRWLWCVCVGICVWHGREGWRLEKRMGGVSGGKEAYIYIYIGPRLLYGLGERLGVDRHQHQVHLPEEVAVCVGRVRGWMA